MKVLDLNMKRYIPLLILPLILNISSCSQSKEVTLEATFVYNHILDEKGEPVAALLFNESYFSQDIVIDIDYSSLIGGDRLTISYSGELYYQETYPSMLVLDGKINSYALEKTRYVKFSLYHVKETYPELKYVITDKQHHYTSLDFFEGEEVYCTYSKEKEIPCEEGALCGPQRYPINSIYAYEPR